MKLKAVFIDIDNTLLDFDAYVRHTMEMGFAHFGLRAYEPWMYGIFTEENNLLWGRIEQGTLTLPELEKVRWNIIFDRLGIRFDGTVFEDYFRRQLNDSAIPVPGSLELLQTLAQTYTLCAASNGPYDQQVRRMTLAGMDRYIRHWFISEQIGCAKPAAAFFQYALRELKLPPEACVMIGDSLSSDIAGGIGSGMHTCWYRRDPGRVPDPCPELIADELSEIPVLLQKLQAAESR